MKLRSKVKILMDDGRIVEVPGEVIPYEYKSFKCNLIVHESEQPWTPQLLDISEQSTGCRCTSTDKTVAVSTKADVKEAMDKFIQDKGIRALQNQMKYHLNKFDLTR